MSISKESGGHPSQATTTHLTNSSPAASKATTPNSVTSDLATSSSTTRKSQRDPLTGLFEQPYLTRKLEQVLARNRIKPVTATLALLQLENFYEIRTWVGKSEANLLLSDIAHLLEKSLPRTVILCRCEHYEFAVLLLNECSLNARHILGQLKSSLQNAASSTIPPQLELKCGFGLARLDQQVPSTEVMFARARHNLSLSHYSNQSDYQFGAESNMEPRLALIQIRQALQDDCLQLSFQPTVSLKEDGLQHYEVRCSLVGSRGQIPSAMLFEIAVQNALGEAIDQWVVNRVLRLLQQRQQSGLRLTINLTHNSLVNPRFLDKLASRLKANPEWAEQLLFQISEIDVLTAQHHMGYFCQRLQDLNIRLSISHFGCTSDPFRYLPLLRAHYVKLDVSLLEKINFDREKRKQLEQTVAQLHERGLRVIAGMVENMSLVPLLWKARLNFVQGYCMQKPARDFTFEFLQDLTVTVH